MKNSNLSNTVLAFSLALILGCLGGAAAGLNLSALLTTPAQTVEMDGDQNWEQLFGLAGPDGDITAIAVSGDDVYVGGNFRLIGAQAFSGVARYSLTTQTWSSLAGGIDAATGDPIAPAAIAVRGDNVYVAGAFRAVRNTPDSVLAVGRIARWNKTSNTWSALGGGAIADDNGASDRVNALLFVGDDLYVGGSFLSVANNVGQRLAASGVARWNQASGAWSALGADAQNNTGNGVGTPPATSGGSFFTFVNTLTNIGTDLYVGGGFSRAFSSASTSVSANNLARWNTLTNTWAALGNGANAAANGTGSASDGTVFGLTALNGELYVMGRFLSVRTSDGSFILSTNLARWNPGTATWTAISPFSRGTSEPHCVGVVNNELFVGGSFDTIFVGGTTVTVSGLARYNPQTSVWSRTGRAEDQFIRRVQAIAPLGARLLIGGSFDTSLSASNYAVRIQHLAAFDLSASQWSVFNTSTGNGVGGQVETIATDGGDVYVGGSFAYVGATVAQNIARWDHATRTWHRLGQGLNGTVRAIAVIGNDVYAAGSGINEATNADGTKVRTLVMARWNKQSQQWSAVVGGLGETTDRFDNRVEAMVASGANLYIGGEFTAARNADNSLVAARNLVRLDTTTNTWFPLGRGITEGSFPSVLSLGLNGNSLYVGGAFSGVSDSAGPAISANNIARWNIQTSAWSALGAGTGTNGNGVSTRVYALATEGADVFAGGFFSAAYNNSGATVSVNRVARWNIQTSAWSALGAGTSATGNGVSSGVEGDIVIRNDEVYFAGSIESAFDGATTIPANGVIRWNRRAGTWSVLGRALQLTTGTSSPVRAGTSNAMAISGTRLFAGGGFNLAGGKTSLAFASYQLPQGNTPPVITLGAALTREQGSASTVVVSLATVSDAQSAASALRYTVTPPAGVTVTGLNTADGNLRAVIAAECGATVGQAQIAITVTDESGASSTAQLPLNITANRAPSLFAYPLTPAAPGQSLTVSGGFPSDAGGLTSVTASVSAGFTGAVSVNAVNGLVSITAAGPAGPHTITVTATDNCSLATNQSFTLLVQPAVACETNGFAPPEKIAELAASRQPGDVQTTDINGDGLTDILTLNGTTRHLTILINKGNGLFSEFLLQPDADTFLVTDLNADQKPDLAVVGNEPAGTIVDQFGTSNTARQVTRIYYGGASDLPRPGPVLREAPYRLFGATISRSFLTLKTTDFLRDGRPDLYLDVNYPLMPARTGGSFFASQAGGLMLVFNRGNEQFSRHDLTYSSAATSSSGPNPLYRNAGGISLVDDFNGDGIPDFAFVRNRSSSFPSLDLTVRLGRPDGSNTESILILGPHNESPVFYDLSFADFDADGKRDLALILQRQTDVRMLLINGAADFSRIDQIPFSEQIDRQLTDGVTSRLARLSQTADFNKDGRMDFALTGETAPFSFFQRKLFVYLTGPGFTFTRQAYDILPASSFNNVVAWGDFNRDGFQDFLSQDAQDRTVVGAGAASGAFTTSVIGNLGLREIRTEDIDADGNADLIAQRVASSPGGGQITAISVFRNSGASAFQEIFSLPASNEPLPTTQFRDFDGDGRSDLGVLIRAGQNTLLATALRNTNNSYSAPVFANIGVGVTTLLAGDLTGDNRADLVVTRSGGTEAQLLINGCVAPPPGNTAPTIAAGEAVQAQQGSPGLTTQIATVSDAETTVGNLIVTAGPVPPGVLLTNIRNNAGVITATVGAGCAATVGANLVTLNVYDSARRKTSATFTVNVTANTPPAIGAYNNVRIAPGASLTIAPASAPTDNGLIESVTVTSPDFRGTLSVNQTSGEISIGAAAPGGTHLVTVSLTDDCGAVTTTNFSITVTAACTPQPANLTNWYRAEGNANDTISPNNGTLQNGATFAPGKTGQAFSLDGTDDAVVIGKNVANFGTSDFSIDLWARADATSLNQFRNIFAKRVGSTLMQLETFNQTLPNGQAGRGRLNFDLSAGSAFVSLRSERTIEDGAFHHLAIVRQGTTMRMFLDGTQEATTTVSSVFNFSDINADFTLGRNAIAGSSNFKGLLDEVSLYTRALTAAEITSIYISGSFGKCVTGNTPPTIIAALQPIARQQGAPGGGAAIATVNDAETPVPQLVVSASPPAGIVVGNVSVDNTGQAFAAVSAGCFVVPGNYNVPLTVTDGNGATANVSITISVTANTPPTLGTYPEVVTVANGGVVSVSPTAPPSDTGRVDVVASAPTFTGLIETRSDGRLFITSARPPGNHIVTVIAQDSCGAQIRRTFTLTVGTINTPPVITASAPLSLPQTNYAVRVPLATISDNETPAERLSINPGAIPTGLIVELLANNGGAVSATIGLRCDVAPGAYQIPLTVTDAVGASATSSFTVNVTAGTNTAPVLGAYAPTFTSVGFASSVLPSAPPMDNGKIVSLSATLSPSTVLTIDQSGVVSIPATLATGGYTVTVTATDHCGTSASRTFPLTVREAPDLTVSALSLPAALVTGEPFEVKWTVLNIGQGPADQAWSDRLYLSRDNQLDSSDVILGNFPYQQNLSAAQSANRIQDIVIPGTAAPVDGAYFLFVSTNDPEQIPENRNNNTRSFAVNVRRQPLPDLTITALEAPTTAFFDQTIAVRWTVSNSGQAPTNTTQWTDAVYLVSDSPTQPGQIATSPIPNVSYLNTGESYTANAEFKIPRGLTGNYRLVVVADNSRFVHEENEQNNQRSQSIRLNVPALPDLTVASVQGPEEAFAGATMLVNWRVENRGANMPQDQANWDDAIYLSQEEDFNPARARLIGQRRRTGALAQGEGYSVTGFSVNVPRNIAGDWYVHVVTDVRDAIYEFSGESNNTNYDRRRRVRIRVTPPDLVIQSLNAPATAVAGAAMSINWTVRNQGAFEAAPAWGDSVYLSADNQLDIKQDTLLIGKARTTLAAGQSYTETQNVQIPTCLSGTYYLFVITDSGDALFEYDPNFNAEQNNVSAPRPIQLTALPPDLQVTSITHPASVVAGQSVMVTWTVANRGAGPAENSWTDVVYLGTNSATPDVSGAQVLGSFVRTGPLAANGTYTRTESVLLPRRTQGTYYLFVGTNRPATVAECANNTNNLTLSSAPLEITNNLPDLTITSVTAPTTAVAGQNLTISWQGLNRGTAAATGATWNDAVMLSTDQIPDFADRGLGAQPISRDPLAINGVYTGQLAIKIPNVAPGNYYLILRADIYDAVYEGRGENNNSNFTAIQLTIPPVDLVASNVVIPAGGFSGQEMAVSWTVTNRGQQKTSETNWTDDVILSRDQIYDPSDRVIGFLPREGELNAGASYQASFRVNIPREASGEYYVFIRTDRHDTVPESDNGNNNAISAGTVRVTLAPPAELAITSVVAPATGYPGELATLTWTVRNSGRNPAQGRWADTVYLSRDTVWDIGDALAGRVTHTGDVVPGASYTESLETVLPALEPGEYYVIVRADAQNQVREENENNNTTVSTSRMTLDIIALALGVPRNDLFTRTGQQRFYRVAAPENETLLYTLTGQNQAAFNELYVRAGQAPSLSASDFQSDRAYNASQEITVPQTTAGPYYAMARAEYVPPGAGAGSDPYTIQADVLPFGTRNISPTEAGNAGYVTLELNGARYQEGAKVRLTSGASPAPAPQFARVTFSKIAALFDLRGVTPGVYDVVVENPGGQTHTLTGGFRVVGGGKPELDVAVIGPDTIRRGRSQIYSVNVRNVGANDSLMSAVFLILPASVGWKFTAGNEPDTEIAGLTREEAEQLTSVEVDGLRVISLIVPLIQAGKSFTTSLEISSPTDAPEIFLRAVATDNFSFLDAAPASLNTSGVALKRNASGQSISKSAEVSCAATVLSFAAKKLLDKLLKKFGGECIGDIFAATVGNIGKQLVHNAVSDVVGADRKKKPASQAMAKLALDITKALTSCAIFAAQSTFLPLLALDVALDTAKLILDLKDINDDCVEKKEKQKNITVNRATDPNDKIGPGGYGSQGWIAGAGALPYTINFENIPTASAAAQRVRVTDQLDQNLDWRTFRLREIGFGKYRIPVPENRAFFQTRVQLGEDLGNQLADISAGIDIIRGEVSWTLTMIDPQTGEQPTAAALGLLAPNDATGRGQGFVTFTIQARTGLATGTQASNKAVIVFDAEESITTNTVTNTFDNEAPVSAVAALPAASVSPVTLTWTGSDKEGGSDLASFDVYVSQDDAPYQLLLNGVTEKSVLFTGVAGSAYRFYSVARDNAGNIEAAPDAPDAVTRTGQQPDNPVPTLVSLDPATTTVSNQPLVVTVNGANFVLNSEVRVNGIARPTAFISPTQLRVTIPASELTTARTLPLLVFNPTPGGGVSAALSLTVAATTNAPVITAAAALTRQQGSAAATAALATVSGAGTLTVTATTIPTGLTLTNITNTNGTITALVAAACSATAGANTVVLTVSDGTATATANLIVNVTANTAPVLGSYPATSVTVGSDVTITPLLQPSDNGTIASVEITAPGIVAFLGTFNVNATTGVVTITNARPAGGHPLLVTVTDNCGAKITQTINLTVTCATITINPATLPNAPVNAAYNQTLTASGGTAPYSFSLMSGALPNGLTLNSNGTITGTPTSAGNATVTVKATDVNGCTATRDYALVSGNPTPVLITLNPSSATVGSGPFALIVTGTNFVNGASVVWNQAVRSATFISATQLRADIPASDIATAGVATITVNNPGPGGGVSNPLTFTINPNTSIRYEGDVWPRAGDGLVDARDVRQMVQFILRRATAAPGGQFQRADTAPKASKGDRRLTTADLVQISRYAAGLDPLVEAGGPTTGTLQDESGAFTESGADGEPLQLLQSGTLTALAGNFTRGQIGEVTIQANALGGENAVSFTLLYDGATLSFLDAIKANTLPANLSTAEVFVNDDEPGKVGVLLLLPAGQTLPAGVSSILSMRFLPNGGAGVTNASFTFGDDIIAREATDAAASTQQVLATTNVSNTVSGNAPAFASAASYLGGAVAPADSIVAIFGVNLATATATGNTIPLPTVLAGTTVTLTDSANRQFAVPLFFVSSGQINCLIPAGAALGAATVTIRNSNGETRTGLLRINEINPALFAAAGTGRGLAAALALRIFADGTLRYENVARFDATANQFVALPIDVSNANEQVFLVLYGTGLRARTDLAEVVATLGGSISGEVLYAGAQGSLAGLDQINIRLPRGLAGRGDIDVALTVDGKAANTVKVNIK